MPGAVDKKGQPKGPPKLSAEEEQAKLQEDPVNERGHYRNGLHLWALYAGDETWRECEVLESMRPASAAQVASIEASNCALHCTRCGAAERPASAALPRRCCLSQLLGSLPRRLWPPTD